MALSFPLTAAAFYDLLRVETVTFTMEVYQEVSGLGNGESIYDDRAPARWRAEVTTVTMENAEANAMLALANSLVDRKARFFLYPSDAAFPAYDPTGTIMGATVPKLGAKSDAYTAAFTGFPAGYQVKRGEFLSVEFVAGRFWLGQWAEDGTADGAGAITAKSLVPALPVSANVGDNVRAIKPAGLFQIEPGSIRPAKTNVAQKSLTFSALQTYRT